MEEKAKEVKFLFIGLIKVQNRAAGQVLTIPPPCLLSLHILFSVGLLFPLFPPQDKDMQAPHGLMAVRRFSACAGPS